MALPGIQGSKPQYVFTVHNSLTRKVWHSVSQQEVGTHLFPLLTPSGGHQNMYGWQVGGGYPTGMLSCLIETSPHIHVFRSASDTVGPAAASARALQLTDHLLPALIDTADIDVDIVQVQISCDTRSHIDQLLLFN